MLKRIKAACHTNEPQMTAVLMFSALNLFAAMGRDSAPWWLYVGAVLFWPIVAFSMNLISPIPKD